MSADSKHVKFTSQKGAENFQRWGDGCIPPTHKVDVQAEVLSMVITPFEKKWGYQAAVWCAFFATRMEGESGGGLQAPPPGGLTPLLRAPELGAVS